MKKYINKIISIFLLISLVVSNLPLTAILAYVRPSIGISSPSKSSVNAGESLSYTITYSDADYINLSSSYVTLNGFTAKIAISGNGDTRVITLSNIQGTSGKKSISIKANSAENDSGYASAIPNSVGFDLLSNSSNQNNNSGNVNTSSTDRVRPSVSISSPNMTKVYNGGTLNYTISFADNKGVERINLSNSYIVLNGFTANISISGKGLNRLVTLSNIQGTNGKKSISIKAGAATDGAGNSSLATPNSVSFELVNKQVVNTTKPTSNNSVSNNKNNISIDKNTSVVKVAESNIIKSTPKMTTGCIDDNGVLGDVNKEVKTFSTSFTSNKGVKSYAQENNYVAQDEEVTYYIDYYNGKETVAKNVVMKLTIPYNVDVLEINANGKIETQNASETSIIWSKSSIQSSEKCRMYVKVRFLQNTLLEKSNNISEQFYVTLNTKYDDKNENTYLRQLFIDKNSNKTATIQKYLSVIDNTNSIRPDDKITRAELAKILVDTGIIKIKNGNTDYKKYKDAEEIPTYAKDAVSALYGTGIIEGFADGEFKPNNPIVRDEFFKIVAKASNYIAGGKLEVKESAFVYTDIIEDEDKTITNNKKYIMELIRQNVIKRADTRSDEYTLRKEAVEVINALTFRGPYVENIKVNVLKFVDISNDSSYFYDVVGASNTYIYSYTDTLWQQIKEVK